MKKSKKIKKIKSPKKVGSHWTRRELDDHAALVRQRQMTDKKMELNHLERLDLEAQHRINEEDIAINASRVEAFYWEAAKTKTSGRRRK